jgi:tetratricopeptide (TPR) repeat protein
VHCFLVTLLAIISALGHPASASDRPAIAVLPFGVAANRSDLRWLGRAVGASLSEALSRRPEVRLLPFDTVLGRLRSAGAKPDDVAWSSAVASRSLGRWMGADLLLIGAVGAGRDRASASQVLGVTRTQASAGKAEVWLAARLEHVSTGEILGRGFAEGRSGDIHALQDEILVQLCTALEIPVDRHSGMKEPVPRAHVSAYRETAEARAILTDLPPGDANDRSKRRAVEKALRKLRKARKQDPESADAWGWAGVAHATAGDWDEARAAYLRALDLDPDLAVAVYGLVEDALQQNDLDEAASILGARCERIYWDDQAHAVLGEILLRSGQEQGAMLAFGNSLEAWPEQPDVLSRLGGLLLSSGRPRDSVRAFALATEIAPGRAGDHGSLAAAYLELGDLGAAREALVEARRLGLDELDLSVLQARVALADGRPSEALGLLNGLSAEADLGHIGLLTLARSHADLGHVDEALDAYRLASSASGQTRHAGEIGRLLADAGRSRDAIEVYTLAIAGEPDRVDLRMGLCELFLATGDRSGAVDQLRKVVHQEPGRADARHLLARLNGEAGDHRAAAQQLQAILALDGSDAKAMAGLARAYLETGQAASSLETYKQALALSGETADLLAGLARAHELLGQSGKARSAYHRALRLNRNQPEALSGLARLPAAPERPRVSSSQTLLGRARVKVASGDLTGAKSILLEATGRYPGNARLWNDLGAVHARLGDRERAREAFAQAVDSDPTSAEARCNIGRMYIQEGATDRAVESLRAALDHDDDFVPALRSLARIELEAGHTSEAVGLLERVVDLDPDDTDAFLALGNALLADGLTDSAEATYHRLLSSPGGPAAAETGLGNVALARGDTAKALSLFQSAARADTGNPAPLVNSGAVYLSQGRHELALAAFQQALAATPSDRALRLNLAILYYQTGQFEVALRQCQTILADNSDDLDALRMVGMVAYAMGQYADAAAAYRMAIQVSPADPQANQGMASAYEALGDHERSARQWEAWLDLVNGRPEYEREAIRVRERLAALGPS